MVTTVSIVKKRMKTAKKLIFSEKANLFNEFNMGCIKKYANNIFKLVKNINTNPTLSMLF
jgi:hypothetical protein